MNHHEISITSQRIELRNSWSELPSELPLKGKACMKLKHYISDWALKLHEISRTRLVFSFKSIQMNETIHEFIFPSEMNLTIFFFIPIACCSTLKEGIDDFMNYHISYIFHISWVSIKTHILSRFEWFTITRSVQFQVLKWTVVNHGSILLILFLTETLARGDSLLIASGFSVGSAVP